MKLLVIRFSSIGDIVLTTPVVRCVKKQLPEAQIHFVTKKSFATIVESNPYISKVFLLDDNWDQLLQQLKNEGYKYVIDLHHNLRSLRIKKTLKEVPAFSFNKLNIQKWLLTALKINRMPALHIVDRYFDTIKELGINNDGVGLDYFIPQQAEVPLTDIPTAHQFGYIGLVIGAAHRTKQLPIEKIKELCALIQYPIILLGGKEDAAIGEQIAVTDSIKIYNACGKFQLNESADLVRKAKLIITHDTGLMHIAAAFKKPILSIWGNTVPAFGMQPYYGDAVVANKIFEVQQLSCRPCSKIGYDKCPRGHFKCMQLQDINAIAKAAQS